MHEMTIATELLEQVLRVTAEHGAGRVEEVAVRCGAIRQVVPEALEAAFAAVACGTPAEGARLHVEEEAIEARCRPCGRSFDCRVDEYLCPSCGRADVEIVRGSHILLTSVVCQDTDGASMP